LRKSLKIRRKGVGEYFREADYLVPEKYLNPVAELLGQKGNIFLYKENEKCHYKKDEP